MELGRMCFAKELQPMSLSWIRVAGAVVMQLVSEDDVVQSYYDT